MPTAIYVFFLIWQIIIGLSVYYATVNITETSWLMAFHREKCNVLTITKTRNSIKFNCTLHGHSLDHVTSAEYIGNNIWSRMGTAHQQHLQQSKLYHRLPQEKSEYCQQISQRKGLSVTSETILRILAKIFAQVTCSSECPWRV
jgi:hypothetical protein